MNRRLRTDLAREIRGSLPRFLSILLMVALGVMFLVGLRSAAPDMRATADAFFDHQRFFDLQLFSTLGLEKGDLEALGRVPGVEAAQGGQTLDGMLRLRDRELVVKLHSLSPGCNEPVIKEGRLPEAPGECALDARLAGSLKAVPGTVLGLRAGDPEALAGEEFTVVGYVDSPLYLSIDRGTSTLGDGSVAGFVLLPEEAFAGDYYTVAYLRLQGAEGMDAYGEDYEALTEALSARLEPVLEALAAERYTRLRENGAADLAEGERQLAEGWEEAQRKLAEAEAELAEGRQELDWGWQDLEQGKQDYETGLREGRAALDAAREALNQGQAELARGQMQLTAGRMAYTMGQSLTAQNLSSAQQALTEARKALARRQQEQTQAEAKAAALGQEAENYRKALEDQILNAILTPGVQEGEYSPEGLAALLAKVSLQEAVAQAAAHNVEDAQKNLSTAQRTLTQAREAAGKLAASKAELDRGEAEYQAGLKRLEQGRLDLEAGEIEYQKQSEEGRKALEEAEAKLQAGEEDYAKGQEELAAGRREAEEARAEAREKLDKAAETLAKLAPADTYVLDRNSNYGFVSYDQNAQRMHNLARMFPVIFYLVAALVCLTTMTRMVEEERTQIGTVKALGYGTGAIAAKYLLYGALAALLGAILGIAVGSTLIPWVIFSSYNIMYILQDLHLELYWGLCLVATGMGLAVTMGATAWAMGSTARQTPAALLRPKAPKPGKRILLERVTPLWRRMSVSAKVSARNLFRYKKRLIMTVIGVAGCTGLLIAGLGLHTSIFDILDVQFFDLYHYDVQLAVDADSPGVTQRVTEALEGAENVRLWTGLSSRSVSFRFGGSSAEAYLSVTGDPETLAQLMDLRDMDSKEPLALSDTGCLIDVKLSEMLGAEPGDRLSAQLDRPVQLTVEGVREHYVYHYVTLTRSLYQRLTGESPTENEYLIALEDNSDQAASDLCRRLMAIEGVRSATNKTATARDFRKTMEVVNAAVMIIVLSAAALAFVVLYNLTNINVTERIRELATIKVLGFYDMEVAMYIYRENMVLTLMGIALGQLLGKGLCAFLIRTVEMDIVMFGRDPKLENYLLSVLLSLAFAVLVNFVMFYRMKKIDMVQALKSVE